MSASAIMIRAHPQPRLVFVGRLTDVDVQRIAALRSLLEQLPRRLRLFDWALVEGAVERLAASLRDELGNSELTRARFVGLPRGGLVVLGLLALRLGVSAEAVGAAGDEGPLVVVDDCALSGARLCQFAANHPHREIVVGVLAAHPGLRRAVGDLPGVRAVLSAVDLDDHAPDLYGEGHAAWVARWRARHPDDLWTGQPDLVAFPWNEPDSALWNAEEGRSEPGWRVLPGSVCLKNRLPVGQDVDAAIIAHEDGCGYLRPAPDVVAGRVGDSVLLIAPQGGMVRLQGTAESFWDVIMSSRTEQAALDALVSRFDADPATLRADLTAFTSDLEARGFLRPAPCT